MKKTFISFIALYAKELSDVMNIDDSLTWVYDDYCTWHLFNGSDADYSIIASLKALEIHHATQTEMIF